MKSKWTLATLAIVGLMATVALAEDNPMYKSWADHGVGTSVTTKSKTTAAGQTSEMESTQTLVEKTDEKVVIEIVTTMVVAGNKMEMPAQKMEIQAKFDTPEASEKEDPPAADDGPKPVTKESEETIEIAGKKYKAKVYDSTIEAEGFTSHVKSWTSNDIPGGVLKTESSTGGQFSSMSTSEVTKFIVK